MNQATLYERFLSFLGFEPDGEESLANQAGQVDLAGRQLDMRFISPRNFEDVTQITDALANGHCAIVNLATLTRDEAKRITDFAFGSVYAVKGQVNRLAEGLFLFTPRNVNLVGPGASSSQPATRSVRANG